MLFSLNIQLLRDDFCFFCVCFFKLKIIVFLILKNKAWPLLFNSVDRKSALGPKGPGFDSS